MDVCDEEEVAQCRALAAASCRQLDQLEPSIRTEINQYYNTRTELDETITEIKKRRRWRPWQYLICRSQLMTVQVERRIVDDSLHDANVRLAQLQAVGMGHLSRYARLSCQQLCNTIMQRLPREIRDMIYELILPSTIIETDDVGDIDDFSYLYWHVPSQTKLDICDYRWQLLLGTHRLPQHCLDESHIGEAMLREIVATWDRTMTFEVDVRTLPYLLRSDYWQHGRTATGVIHNLNVVVPVPNYQLCRREHEHSKEQFGIYQDHPEMIFALRHLSYLDINAKISIHMQPTEEVTRCIRESNDSDACRKALLRYVKPMMEILEDLHGHGRRVQAFRVVEDERRV